MPSTRAKVILSLNSLTCTSINGMYALFSVIEIIEEDESEEVIEAVEPAEVFDSNSLPDNMEATEEVEKIEIESKSPRVSSSCVELVL